MKQYQKKRHTTTLKIGDTVKWNGKLCEIQNLSQDHAQISFPINQVKFKRNTELVLLKLLEVIYIYYGLYIIINIYINNI